MWLSRFIAAQLFQVTPRDPTTLLAVVVLFVVCAVAVVAPLLRATRIEPAETLRAE